MEISTGSWHISIVDEARSSFNSRKIRSYPVVVNLDDPAPPYSVYGIFCNTAPVVLLAACAGGPTVVHAHSAFVLDGRLYVTIANRIVCLSLRPFTLHWVLGADDATCCGVYFHSPTRALLARGELSISRFTEAGALLWQSPGRDIFTGPLSLESAFVQVLDCMGREYRFRYHDGSAA